MKTNFAKKFYNSAANISLSQAQMNYTAQVVSANIKMRQAQEIAKVNAKYQSQFDKAAALEAQVNKNFEEKTAAVNYLTALESNTKKLDDVRLQISMASDALSNGSAEAFNLAINILNQYVGTKIGLPDSLIADQSGSTTRWDSNIEIVSGGGVSVALQKHYLGTDYAITTAEGHVYKPSDDAMEMTSLNGGKNFKIADVTFEESNGYMVVRDKDSGDVLVEGEMKRGGLGVLHAQLYGDFSTLKTPEGKEMHDRIKADLDKAMRYVAQVELKLNQYEAGLSAVTKSLDSKNTELTNQYRKMSDEAIDAKQAEIKAITNRYEIAANSLALTSGRSSTFIFNMFQKDYSFQKQSLTDVMMGLTKG